METLPYEAQMALVSALTAFLVGGTVSAFGAPAVIGATRFAVSFALRRRFVTGLGLSALTGLGFFGSGMMSGSEAETVNILAGLLS